MRQRTVIYCLLLLCLLLTFQLTLYAAQDSSQWHLPEGAIARLGKGSVNDIAFSPDGSHLAVVSDIGVWIYDALTGTEQALLAGHTEEFYLNAAFSPNGDMLAVIVYDYPDGVQLWDTKTWTLKSKLRGFEHRPIDIAFSPDGQTIAIAEMGQTTQLWDMSTMEPKCILEGSTDDPANEGSEYFDIAYSPNGDTFAIGTGDGTVRLWNAATGKLKHTFTGNITPRGSFSFSPDGKTIATRSFSNTIWLWDTTTGTHKYTIEKGIGMMGGENIAYSPNGDILAIPAWNGLQMWDTETGKHINTLGNSVGVENFLFSPDGKSIATVSMSENNVWTVWLSDPTTSDQKIKLEHSDEVENIAFSPDGKMITTVSVGNTVRVWNTTTGTHKYMLEHTDSVVGVSYNPDKDNMITSVHQDNTVRVWDTQTGTRKHSFRLREHTKNVKSVAFSPNGKTVATSSQGSSVLLSDITTGENRKMQIRDQVYSIGAFSPDGQTLVALGESQLFLLALDFEKENKILNIHNLLSKPSTRVYLRSIAYSPDGNTIAIQMDDRIISWDITTEKVVFTLEQVDRETRIKGVVFSPDGYTIATTRGGRVQLWDIQRQEHKLTLSKDWNFPLKFSSDGKIIATFNYNTVRLFDTTSGVLKKTLSGHTLPVKGVMFSPDGNTIATASQDGTVLLWDLTSQHLNSNKED